MKHFTCIIKSGKETLHFLSSIAHTTEGAKYFVAIEMEKLSHFDMVKDTPGIWRASELSPS